MLREIKERNVAYALEAFSPEGLMLFWQDWRLIDQQSAQVLQARLDSEHPSWREDLVSTSRKMTREKAFKGLGLPTVANHCSPTSVLLIFEYRPNVTFATLVMLRASTRCIPHGAA